MSTMTWPALLNRKRLRRDPTKPPATWDRSEFAVDQERILFSQSFRRLQAKTQVHPLPFNDHVRQRLIHSLEVSAVAHAIGCAIGKEIITRHQLNDYSKDDFGDLMRAACLAHDIGNPPFGHAGEDAIRDWFENGGKRTISQYKDFSDDEWKDLSLFEGNAQGFRTITQIENYRLDGGLQLTFATLGTFTKYPWDVTRASENDEKFGFYLSEKKYFEETSEEVGLILKTSGRWCHHPMARVLEAADDIAYATVDLEDGIEIGAISIDEYIELLRPFLRHRPRWASDYESLTDNEQRISFLRSKAMVALGEQVKDVFLSNENKLLAGTYDCKLLDEICYKEEIEDVKKKARNKIFNHERKIYAEISCYEVLSVLLEEFMNAVAEANTVDEGCRGSRYKLMLKTLMGSMAPDRDATEYEKVRRVIDFVSGMTDRFALGVYRQIKGISLGGMTPAPVVKQ